MRQQFQTWNKSTSSSERSTNPDHASNRIFDGYFTPRDLPGKITFSKTDPIFAMGSCFAREIEHALSRENFNVSSTDYAKLASADFSDNSSKAAGGVRSGFFHRFNVPSMATEFRRAAGDGTFDEENDLLLAVGDGTFADLNYFSVLRRVDHRGTVARRQATRNLVANFKSAKVIIVTLGLTEAWVQKSTGLYCNALPGDVLKRYRDQFDLRSVGYQENMEALEKIHDCIARHHKTGDFTLFVTVSPVPLSMTFTLEDVVVANQQSKSTLRAVAGEFCKRHPNTIYFPSYEIAMYSRNDLVWRPDRVHIHEGCVSHITDTFIGRYYSAT